MNNNYKISTNNPIKKLSEDTDHFGTLDKAEAIKEFLSNCFNDINEKDIEYNEDNTNNLKDDDEYYEDKNIKIISLYGNWGSGKSSVIEYLKENLDKEKFKAVIFEAWQHEKDNELNLSLIDCISSLDKTSETGIKKNVKNLFKASFKFFKPLSNFSLNIPLGTTTPTPALVIKPSEILKAFEELNLEDNSLSFHSKLETFKKAFIEMEHSILGKNTDKKIIVFIDDLDRCEAEHVINILSSIKNFFKYGKRTIFFCALDKNAVTKAVQTKYEDVIKSEEYLEKIFDVSFNMPSIFSIKKLLINYFNQNDVKNIEELEIFFKEINFTNPRHLKKVLNKYEIIKSFKFSPSIPQKYKNLIPEILKPHDKTGNVLETILTFFIIILHEFYNDKFNELENYEGKFKSYVEDYYESYSKTKSGLTKMIEIDSIFSNYKTEFENINLKDFFDLNLKENPKKENGSDLLKSLIIFTPKTKKKFYLDIINTIEGNSISDINRAIKNFIEQFNEEENKILYLFSKYLYKLKTEKKETIKIDSQNYLVKNLFEMARELL